MIAANPLRLLLDRIRADKIAPIGIDEYLQVDRLLLRCPELGQPEARETLRYALASLLATDVDQWKRVWNLSTQYFDADQVERVVKPIGQQADAAPPPIASPRFATRLVRGAADLPRWLLALGVTLLVGIIAALALFSARPFEHVAAVSPPLKAEPTTAVEVAQQWRKVPVEQKERKIDVSVPQKARDLAADDVRVFVISGVLLIIGGCWVLLPWQIRMRRMKQAQENADRGLQLRREMSREAERNNVQRRLTYHVPHVAPMREDAAADTATMLGRLFGHIHGEVLDVDRTIDATVAHGGRFVAVTTERRVSHTLTILVDVEGGSHPWLNDIQWLLDRWHALGVQFQRYDFSFEPLFLTEAATKLPISLEKVARRAEGEPLLMVSRRLTGQDFRGEARWLRHAQAWPVRAWLDPAPRPPEELPQAYQSEIDRLARRGFRRFPLTENGLVTLAYYLVSEGQGAAVPKWPALPALSDPKVEEAVEKWGLFASLVPDATWEQLQAVRESFPEIRAVLPESRHLQRLLDWAEFRNPGHQAESSDGATLELDTSLVDALILRFRKAESELPEAERLEARCRELLLLQLGATEPDNPLMRQFWQLKRMRHQLALDPEKALALLGPLIAGPWHNEAIEAVSAELDRDKAVRTLPRATRDGFRMVAEADSNCVRLADLIRPPRLLLAGTAGAVAVLIALAGLFLEYSPVVPNALLSVSYNFEGIVPQDYRVEPSSPEMAASETVDASWRWLNRAWLIKREHGITWITHANDDNLVDSVLLGLPHDSDSWYWVITPKFEGTVGALMSTTTRKFEGERPTLEKIPAANPPEAFITSDNFNTGQWSLRSREGICSAIQNHIGNIQIIIREGSNGWVSVKSDGIERVVSGVREWDKSFVGCF